MRILRSVVEALVASVFGRWSHALDSRHVAGQLSVMITRGAPPPAARTRCRKAIAACSFLRS
jgi:hypothetical protein